MPEDVYWLAFALCPGIGPTRFQRLLHVFHTAKEAWQASEAQLIASGVGEASVRAICEHRSTFHHDKYESMLATKKIGYIPLYETHFPMLSALPRKPIVIFYKGNHDVLLSKTTIAVVGTRSMTPYGKSVTSLFTAALVQAGCCIVSGLAMGVDAVAHEATLESRGKTIAVLGSGVDICTPRENERLYNEIIDRGGVIISEMPPGQFPTKGSFPARNRIIAGLAQAVVVTEGAVDSGSLITAHFALALKRPVYTIPGPITSRVSQGPYALLKKGATLVTTPKELLDALQLQQTASPKRKVHMLDSTMQQIVDCIASSQVSVDYIIKATHLPPAHVASMLSLMEVQGIIRHIGNGEVELT